MESNLNGTISSHPEGEEQFPLYFGAYEALKSIGKGKFAVVYRARKIGDDNVVALKRISVDMIDEKAREKCLKEVRLLQSLDHPNIIRYMDSFIWENNLMIVYEWAAAGDLKRQLRKAQERGVGFEERVIWKYFSQISNAMQHMHERRIMHRDLKPANIFLTLDGTIKVGDLGLSRELSEHTIQAHSKVGTPLYMSPEVLKGDGYDFKSDVWSLGCLLYELAMLKSPFKSEGLNLYSLFQKISNGDFQPLPDNYSEELRSLVYEMISTRPQDRPDISYVCNIAQKMRGLTSDKSMRQKSKSNLLASSPSTISITPPPAEVAADNDFTPQFDEEKQSNQELINKTKGSPLYRKNGAVGGIAYFDTDTEAQNETKAAMEAETPSKYRIQHAGNQRDAVDSKTSAKKTAPMATKRNEVDTISPTNMLDENANPYNRMGVNFPTEPKQSSINRTFVPTKQTPSTATVNSDLSDEDTLPIEKAKNLNFNRIEPTASYNRNGNHEYSNEDKNNTNVSIKPIYPSSKYLRNDQNFNDGDNNDMDLNEANNINTNEARSVTRRPKSANKNVVSERGKNGTAPVNGTNEAYLKPPLEKGNSANSINTNHSMQVTKKGRVDSASSKKKLAEGLLNASPAFAVMEEVYGKLILLGCPMNDPDSQGKMSDRKGFGRLLPIHFACDLNAFNAVAGHEAGYQFMQFQRFVKVTIWLCKNKIGGLADKEASKIDLDHDSPTMIAKQILRILQVVVGANDPSIDMTEITPTSLTHGFGIHVCNALNALADAAMKKCDTELSSAWNNRVYPTVLDEIAGMDDDNDVTKDEIEEELFGLNLGTATDVGDESVDMGMSITAVAAPILVGVVDPALWREETERVAIQLRNSNNNSMEDSSWGQHIESFKSFLKKISLRDQQQQQQQQQQSTITNKKKPDEDVGNALLLAERLDGVKLYLENTLNKIKSAERMLNLNEVVTKLGLSYSQCKEELLAFEQKQGQHQQAIDRLASELSEIDERTEESLLILQEKTGTGVGEGVNNNAVIRLRDAIHTIKKEVREMNITEQILSQTLLKERVTLAMISVSKRNAARSKKNESLKRLGGGKKGKSNINGEDLYTLSDEDI